MALFSRIANLFEGSPSREETMLFGSARLGDLAKLKSLMEGGVDIHAQRERALYIAVAADQKPIVQFLIKHGANVDVAQKTGGDITEKNRYPLQAAVLDNNVTMVQLLLDAGAQASNALKESEHLVSMKSGLVEGSKEQRILDALKKNKAAV
jgi:ankyrin repeat protein